MSEARATEDRGASGATPGTAIRMARTGYRWALILFLIAGAVQIFLAGLGVFHLHAYGLDEAAGDSALDPHRTLGFTMGGIAIAILVLALLARAGRQAIALAVLLVALTSFVQSLLAGLADDHAIYGGLHALDGLLIIAIAGYLLYQAARGRGASRPEGQPDRQAQEAR